MAAGTLRSFTGSMLSGLEKIQGPFVQEPPTQAATHISIRTDVAAAASEEEAKEEGPTTVAERGAVWLCVRTTTHGGTMDKGDDALAAAPVHTDVRTQDVASIPTPMEIDDGYSEAPDKFVPFTIRKIIWLWIASWICFLKICGSAVRLNRESCPSSSRGFVAAVREADLRQTWPFTEGLLRWRTQCRGDQPGILPPLDSAIPFKHSISSIRDHLSDTQILRPRELDSIAANAKESTEDTTHNFLYGTAAAARKEDLAEEIQTCLKGHNNSQEVEAEGSSAKIEKLQSSVEVVQALRPSSSVTAVCGEILAGDQPLSATAMRLRAHGRGSVGPIVGSQKLQSQIGRSSSGARVVHVLQEPTVHEAPDGIIVESGKASVETDVVQRKAEIQRNSLRHLENGDYLQSDVEAILSRGNERIDEKTLRADKQSEHHGFDHSAKSHETAEGAMTSCASDRRIEAEVDDFTAAARERSQVEGPIALVSGFKRQEAGEVQAGLRSLDSDEEALEVEESGTLSTGLETQAEESVTKHSATGKNLADGSLVQSVAVQPPVRVTAIESRSQKTSQVVETARSPGVAEFPPGFIAGGEERVCPVCLVFASPSNTALNVHIDQCLVKAPANSMDRLNRTQTLLLQQQQQQQGRQQKFKVKTQKKRSLADLCALAPRKDLEDSGKSGSGSRESSPAAEPEVAGPAARRQPPEIRRQPRTAFVRGEPPAAATATAPKKVRSGSAPMTAGRFAGPTDGPHPGIHRSKKQRLSSDSATSNFAEKRALSAIDQRDSDLQTKHKHRKLSGKHTVRANSSSSPTVSTGVKKTSTSSVALQKQNSIGSAAGAHKGASSSSSLPELQLPSLMQSSMDTKVWSKHKPDCRKDPAKPVVIRGKGDLEGNASEEEVHQDVVELVAQNQIECAATTPSPNGLGDEPGLSPGPRVLGPDKGMGLDTSALQKIPSALEKKQPQVPPASVGSMSKIVKTVVNGTVISQRAALSARKARKLGLSTSTIKSGNNKSCTAATKENGTEPRPGSPVPVRGQDLVNGKSSLGICCDTEDHTRDQLLNHANNNPTQCTAINSATELNKKACVVGLKETVSVLEQQQETSLTSNAAGEGGEGNMRQQLTGKGKKLSRKKGDPVGSLTKPVTNKSQEPNTKKEKLKRKRPFLGYTEKEAPHLMSRSNATLREVLGLKQCFGEGGTPLACKPFECKVGSTPAVKLTTLQAENPPAGEKTQAPDTSANVAPSFQRVDGISKDTANMSAGVEGSVDPILESQNSGVHPRSEVDGCLIEKAREEKLKDWLQHLEEGEINDLNQSPDSRLQVPSSHPCSTESNPGSMTGKSLPQQTIDSQSQIPCELQDSQTPEDQGKDMREATPVPTQSSPKRADWSPTLSHNTSKRKSSMKSAVRNTLGATNTKDAGEPVKKPTVLPRGPGGRFISTKPRKEGGDNASGSSTKGTLEVLSNRPKVQSASKNKPVHTLLSPPHWPESSVLCDGVSEIDTLKAGPSTSIPSSISEAPAQAAGYSGSDHASDERLQYVAPITHATVEETTRCTFRGGSMEPIDTYRASPSPQWPNVSALCVSKTPTDTFCHGANPDNLPIGVRRSPVHLEQASQATGNQHSEKGPTTAVQAGTIANFAPLQHGSTNSMTSPLVSRGIGTSTSYGLTGGQTKAVAEVDSQVAKLPGWILAAITEQPPTEQTSQDSQALTDSRDFERSRGSLSPAREGVSHGDPSIVRLFGNPVLRLMGKNVLVSNDDKGGFGHKQKTTEASPLDEENLKELQAGKAVDVTYTSTTTALDTGVGTAEAVLEMSDATASIYVSGAAGWGPLEVETSDGNPASSQVNRMFSLVTAPSEAMNTELVVPWQAGDANQHGNKGSNKHSLDLQFEDSSVIRKGGLASNAEWQAENSLAGLDMTTNLGSFSTSLPGESRSPTALKIKRKSLSLNGRGAQPPPGQEVIIIDDLPGVDSLPEPRHQELTIDVLIKAGALRRLPPELDVQTSKSKAPGARGPVMELDCSRIPQLSGVSQSDLLVELRKLGLVPAMHMAPRSFNSAQVPKTDHNSTNHKMIAPKPPHTITPSGLPDSPTTAPSPRNLSPSAGREALGLPPWLLAAKKHKEAQMATNLIVLDDDDRADESPSSSSKISVHVPLGSPSPCSTSTSGGPRTHARYSTPSPVAPVTKFRGQGTTSLLQSAVLRQAGGLTAPNKGVNLGFSVGSGRSSSGMMSPRSGERGYQRESGGVVLPSPHVGDRSQILERRGAVCAEKETSPVCNIHRKQIEQAGKLPPNQDKLLETVCEGSSRPRNESNLSGSSHSWISGINGGLKRGEVAQTRRAPRAFPTETDATQSTQLETLGLLDCLGMEQPMDGMHATKTSSVTSRSSIAPPRWEDIPRVAGDLRLQAESTAPPDSRSILFQHPIPQRQPSHISGDLSVNLHNGSELRDHTPVDSIQATGISPNLARTLSSHRTPVPSPGALLTDTRASMRSIEQPLRPAALGSLLERRNLPHMLERLVTSSDGSISMEKGMAQTERHVLQNSVSRGEQQASPGIPSNMTKGMLFPEMVRNGEEAQFAKAPVISIPAVSNTVKRQSSLGRPRQQSLSGNSSSRDIPDLMTMTPLGKQVARNAFYREKQPMDSSVAQATIDTQTGSDISGLCSMNRSQAESFSHTLTRQISALSSVARQPEQVLGTNQLLRNQAGSTQMFLDLECQQT